ncbi:MAG: hypothetical protein ABH804_01550 [archaeon]
MNRNQWFVLGIGFIIFSSYMFWNARISPFGFGYCNALILNDEQMIACFIHRYLYVIPALISGCLGWIFLICGFLEPKKKN